MLCLTHDSVAHPYHHGNAMSAAFVTKSKPVIETYLGAVNDYSLPTLNLWGPQFSTKALITQKAAMMMTLAKFNMNLQ